MINYRSSAIFNIKFINCHTTVISFNFIEKKCTISITLYINIIRRNPRVK